MFCGQSVVHWNGRTFCVSVGGYLDKRMFSGQSVVHLDDRISCG